MFWQSYKTTIKNLTRSGLFWAMVAAVFFELVYDVLSCSLGMVDPETLETIIYTDPRYVMAETTYLQLASNRINSILLYALPCLIVVSVMLIHNRDFGDHFFEIEHAGGVKPSHYFLGRFAALASVTLLVAAIVTPLGFHWYYFSRGGLPGLEHYFTDSAVRMLRQYFLGTAPVILMYLGIAYVIGCLVQSGGASAIGGITVVLLHYLGGIYLRYRMPAWYRFFDPMPTEKHVYLSYYGTGRGAEKAFTTTEMALWIAVMLGLALLGFVLSYLSTRRREL